MNEISRRRFVAGSTGVVAIGLAGCTGQDGGDGGGNGGGMEETESPTETETGTETDGGESDFTENEQRVVDFLTSEPATDNWEDTFDDLGEDEPTIAVGAQGNDGNFAFDPPAAKVSTGTTITWQWTGKGDPHNVASVQDSDFDFRSGEPESGADVTYEHTFEEAGVALYVCEPHRSLGMKGGIVVEEG